VVHCATKALKKWGNPQYRLDRFTATRKRRHDLKQESDAVDGGDGKMADFRAAQYVRMSTEHQQYSTHNQADKIREYAEQRGIEIVKTYADDGKSGLSIGGRASLQKLIADVEAGVADFNVILVYDVSRWGRFQDADESAYYEYICKRAGIRVGEIEDGLNSDGGKCGLVRRQPVNAASNGIVGGIRAVCGAPKHRAERIALLGLDRHRRDGCDLLAGIEADNFAVCVLRNKPAVDVVQLGRIARAMFKGSIGLHRRGP
jgi:predicted site-specific integrase-resolvase